MNRTVEKIPTWAFGYIFNGDMTGLTEEEVKLIDDTLKRIGADLFALRLMKHHPPPISQDTRFSDFLPM